MEMGAGLPVVVEEVTRGHLKLSSKVISRYKGDLTKKFVSGIIGKVIYLGVWKMNIEMLAVMEYVTRGYWRSLAKVI